MLGVARPTVVEHRCGDREQLDVRRRLRLVGAQERDRLAEVRRRGATAPGDPACEHPRVAVGAVQAAAVRADDHPRGDVVLQVRTDRGPVEHDVDAVTRELVGGTDPGAHQDHGRHHRTGCEDDLAACAHGPDLTADADLDADRTAVLDEDAVDGRGGAHGQPARPERGASAARTVGPQVGVGGGHPPAASLRDHRERRAVRARVVVVDDPHPELGARVEERERERPRVALTLDAHRSPDAACRRETALVVLDHLEERVHPLGVPSGRARGGPAVEVDVEPSHPHHRVDR